METKLFSEEDQAIYHRVLEKMEVHMENHPDLYIDDNNEFIDKKEFYVTNDISKGVKMIFFKDCYWVDVYVSDGKSIIVNLNNDQNNRFQDFPTAKIIFDNLVKKLPSISIKEILLMGEKNFE